MFWTIVGAILFVTVVLPILASIVIFGVAIIVNLMD